MESSSARSFSVRWIGWMKRLGARRHRCHPRVVRRGSVARPSYEFRRGFVSWRARRGSVVGPSWVRRNFVSWVCCRPVVGSAVLVVGPSWVLRASVVGSSWVRRSTLVGGPVAGPSWVRRVRRGPSWVRRGSVVGPSWHPAAMVMARSVVARRGSVAGPT